MLMVVLTKQNLKELLLMLVQFQRKRQFYIIFATEACEKASQLDRLVTHHYSTHRLQTLVTYKL